MHRVLFEGTKTLVPVYSCLPNHISKVGTDQWVFRAALVSLLKVVSPCLHMVFCLLLKHTLKIQKVRATSGLKVPYGATSQFWDYLRAECYS